MLTIQVKLSYFYLLFLYEPILPIIFGQKVTYVFYFPLKTSCNFYIVMIEYITLNGGIAQLVRVLA